MCILRQIFEAFKQITHVKQWPARSNTRIILVIYPRNTAYCISTADLLNAEYSHVCMQWLQEMVMKFPLA
jgi:uncharacterized membrane protein